MDLKDLQAAVADQRNDLTAALNPLVTTLAVSA
jgi:hypothetical protein